MYEGLRLTCASRIDRVTVYARGAVVTRVVALPEALPEGPCVLDVRAAAPAFDPRSLRANAVGARAVLALDAREVDAREAIELGPIEAEVERLSIELDDVRARIARINERRGGLASVWPDPRLRPRRAREDGAARVRDALSVSSLADAMIEQCQSQLRDEERREVAVLRALEAAKLRLAQASSSAEGPASRRALSVLVQLAAATEGARLASLELEYVVDGARWWPAYKVRLSDGARRARWSLDAYIAQCTGEDWSHASVSLSTADLVRDARLPTLASLRLGRAQPAKKAFRAPPQGLDELFSGYDVAAAKLPPPRPASPVPATTTITASPVATLSETSKKLEKSKAALGRRDEASEDGGAYQTGAPEAPEQHALGGMSPAYAAMPPPPMAMPMPSAPPMSRSAAPRAKADDGFVDVQSQSSPSRGGGGPPPRQAFGAAPSDELDPDEQWMDFDGLSLSDPASRGPSRGRLSVTASDRFARERAVSRDAIERVAGPSDAIDPLSGRGQFDHRYEGVAPVDVLSDGRLHRVSVAEADGHAKPRWRTVPKESPEVFREAEVQNPFDAPLLGGPAEVFYDDALVARARVDAVDRGGTIALGLGLEERVRVARNARVQESTVGLLSGSTQVDHHVTIELSSALGEPLSVEVVDRVPWAKKDDEVEVSLVSSKPKAVAYTQAERRSPVEGGLKWLLDVAPGAKATVEFHYRVVFSSKLELTGGNRRD
jgi:hypothetical protein